MSGTFHEMQQHLNKNFAPEDTAAPIGASREELLFACCEHYAAALRSIEDNYTPNDLAWMTARKALTAPIAEILSRAQSTGAGRALSSEEERGVYSALIASTEPATPAGDDVEERALVVEVARDLVALWQNPHIKGLPRAERNEAIDDTRQRLINAVEQLGEPFPEDAVEAVTKAIVNTHSRRDHHMDYAAWIKEEKRDGIEGENAREWMAARRLEARNTLTAMPARREGGAT